MITPLAADGSIDHDAIERMVDHLIDGGVGGVFVLGSSGEGPWFTPAEGAAVVRSAVRASGGRVPVLAGVLEPSTNRVLEAAREATAAGADGLVVTTPYYFAVDEAAITLHFERVAARVSLPIVLYNIPQMTHNPLRSDVVARLLRHDAIVGIKDSSGDAIGFAALLELRSVRPDFRVLQGSERDALFALRAGCDGLVPGLGNVATPTFVRMMRAVAEGRLDEAEDAERAVHELWTLHTHGPWLACLKHAAARLGFGNGTTLAGDTLAPAARAAIEAALATFSVSGGATTDATRGLVEGG